MLLVSFANSLAQSVESHLLLDLAEVEQAEGGQFEDDVESVVRSRGHGVVQQTEARERLEARQRVQVSELHQHVSCQNHRLQVGKVLVQSVRYATGTSDTN